MFLQKFDILLNKQALPITNFNDEVTKLPASDKITRIDGNLLLIYSLIYSSLFTFLKFRLKLLSFCTFQPLFVPHGPI
jgi:hypothetical protein